MSDTVIERPPALGPHALPAGAGLLLGRGRRHLQEVLAVYAAPRRIVSVERDPAPTVDLEQTFPDATVWEDTLAGEPAWAGWPDLLWLGFALSARDVDPEEAVATAWRALPAGAIVACVDVQAVEHGRLSAGLLRRLGIDADRDSLRPLRRRFAPLELTFHAHPAGLWRTYAFVGRKATG